MCAVAQLRCEPDLRGKLAERGGNERQAGDHAGLARDHGGARLRVLGDRRHRGHVAGTPEILSERADDHRIDLERREERMGTK